MKKTRIVEVSAPRSTWWEVQTRSLLWPFWRTRLCSQHPADAQAAVERM